MKANLNRTSCTEFVMLTFREQKWILMMLYEIKVAFNSYLFSLLRSGNVKHNVGCVIIFKKWYNFTDKSMNDIFLKIYFTKMIFKFMIV